MRASFGIDRSHPAATSGRGRSLLIVIVGWACSTACTLNDYKDLPPERQREYYGTQPGYHRLSNSFAVDVSHGLMTFYFLGPSGTEKGTVIGVVTAAWSDYANFGHREIAYAISEDGKRLLFFDEPGVDKGKPIPTTKDGMLVTALYRLDADKGERELIYRDINRHIFSCIDFPRNTVSFGKIRGPVQFDHFAYTTEGDEISLDDRNRKLLGDADKICGPL